MILWEWVDSRGGGVLSDWRNSLATAQKAQLDNRTRLLSLCADDSNLPGLMSGPISVKGQKFDGVYKLQIGGKVRLRPLLRKGPGEADHLTFLAGAMEKNGRFDPTNAPSKALERSRSLDQNANRRKRYEIPPSTSPN